jgi:predicted ATPase
MASAIAFGVIVEKVVGVDRFILTGPPGAGKTTILRQLAGRVLSRWTRRQLT